MTRIKIFRKNKNIVKFEMSGHSGGESGTDIVCAALSAVSHMALSGIENVVGVRFDCKVSDGYLHFELPHDLSAENAEKCAVLLDSMYLFFLNLQEQYGGRVSVSEMEVKE